MRCTRTVAIVTVAWLALSGADGVRAESPHPVAPWLPDPQVAGPLGGSSSEGYGPNTQFITFGGSQFHPEASDEGGYYQYSHGYYTAIGATGLTYFTADIGPSIGVPVGAVLTSACVLLYDNTPTGEISLFLQQHEQPLYSHLSPATVQLGATQSSGYGATPGYTYLCLNLSGVTIHAVDDVNNDGTVGWVSYALVVRAYRSLNIRWGNGIVSWYRQVSPAPASATFNDVSMGHWAFRHIEALAASGITAGCGANQFCPDAPLTRAQMAVFLAKALGLHFTS